MDRIRELASFVAAVESGSFVKAADALRTSKAVISKHVLGLEQRLGARLLNRTTRRQSLTDAGRTYFERAKQILEELEDADAAVASSALRPTGTLRVTAPLTFGLLYDRVVSVVHTETADTIRVISIRKATKREQALFFEGIQD